LKFWVFFVISFTIGMVLNFQVQYSIGYWAIEIHNRQYYRDIVTVVFWDIISTFYLATLLSTMDNFEVPLVSKLKDIYTVTKVEKEKEKEKLFQEVRELVLYYNLLAYYSGNLFLLSSLLAFLRIFHWIFISSWIQSFPTFLPSIILFITSDITFVLGSLYISFVVSKSNDFAKHVMTLVKLKFGEQLDNLQQLGGIHVIAPIIISLLSLIIGFISFCIANNFDSTM